MTDAATLAVAPRASVAAAAGCGKTHLISEAVCRHGSRRDLVLTHTHAGVDALRRRMHSLRNGASGFAVETIAGWALRYASAFPQTSGLRSPLPKTPDEWNSVYEAAHNLLVREPIREVLRASYSGAYVDEYQDCTLQQHGLVLAIAEVIPTRILGDPLQGIFDFGQNRPVDWDRDIRPSFAELPALTRPWRWEAKNPELGQWLASVRQDLLQGRPVNLTGAPIRWERLPATKQIVGQVGVCLEIARQAQGTVVAIYGMPQQCHFVASRLKSLYQCVEPIEAPDLFRSGGAIEAAHGPARAAAVIDFASKCMTRVGTALRRVRDAYQAGGIPRTRARQLFAVHEALRRVVEDDSFSTVIAALERIQSITQAVMYRRELFEEMIRGLRATFANSNESLQDALWVVRNRTRAAGRRLGRCVVGTTLLVKGLEFDHAVILDADAMDAKDLYVALTRAARSLTVFSRTQTITPRSRGHQTI